jgi:phosphatidylglycerol lysyltransferase
MRPPGASTRDEARALRLVAQHGRTGTAFQVVSPGLAHWFDEGPDGDTRGMVAYADTGSAWVAAGEPVAAAAEAIAVAERFVAAAHAAHRRVSFFGTEGILASSPRFRRFHLGEQPVWDPRAWAAHVSAHRSLREQLRRARAKRVVVRSVSAEEYAERPALRAQLETVVRHWLAARPMPPMRFLVEVAPLMLLAHRRVFIAERADVTRGDVVVALLSLAPVPARGGWLFEHLLRDPDAPNGTSELLVDAAMRSLANDGVAWATLGLAPLAGAVPRWLRWTRTLSRPLFNFEGLAAFKRKLRPQHWEPIYLAYPAGSSSGLALLDGLRAFAGGPLWRFGVRTVLRGPSPLLAALERLLIPWTLLLAVAPTRPWFPSRGIHAAWVLFDLALYAVLRTVRRHSWMAGARIAAAAVTLDAALSLLQALVWNAPRLTSWRDGVFVIIACIGPLLTAPTLWGAARRLQRLREVAAAR